MRQRYKLWMWAAATIPEEFSKFNPSVSNFERHTKCWIEITPEEIVELSNRYDVFIRGATKEVDYPILFVDGKGRRFTQR